MGKRESIGVNFMKKFFIFLFLYIFFLSSVSAQDLRFVQITDVRYSTENNNLTKVIKDVNKKSDIDFVVFTGDNIQSVDKKNLKDFILEAKKLKYPFYILIGDKDVNKYKDLSKKQYAFILKKNLKNYKNTDTNYIFEKKGVVFFVGDGAKDVIPSTNGYFKENVLEWLDANLALYQNKNVIILQHFPVITPVDKESYVTLKPEKYIEILNNNKNVKAIVSGHFGVNKEIIVDGVSHISTAPAPSYRIIDIIDCNSENPTIWAEVYRVE